MFAQTANKSNWIDSRFERCMDKSGGVTSHMNDCFSDAFQQWDKELNKNYKGLMQYLNPKQQKALRTAQRAWIRFRDAEMNFMSATPSGGTMDSLTFGDKNLVLTKQRAIELKEQMLRVQKFSGAAIHDGSKIPEKYHGTWDSSSVDCKRNLDDVRVTITADSIAFWESDGKVISIQTHGADLVVQLELSGEGETWTDKATLSSKGDKVVVNGAILTKCN